MRHSIHEAVLDHLRWKLKRARGSAGGAGFQWPDIASGVGRTIYTGSES
jgi:hypothetical protein